MPNFPVISKNSIISDSSPWLSAFLNIIPGLGTGYIYQRRWKAYWYNILALFFIFLVTYVIQLITDPYDPLSINTDSLSFWSILILSLLTAIESYIKVINLRQSFINK